MTVYGPEPAGPGSYMGHYRAIIVDVSDPLGKARLKIEVPAVFALDKSAWAPLLQPPNYQQVLEGVSAEGGRKGAQVGEHCMVVFENGDPAYPIVVGLYTP